MILELLPNTDLDMNQIYTERILYNKGDPTKCGEWMEA